MVPQALLVCLYGTPGSGLTHFISELGGASLEDRAAAEALERTANELNPAHSEARAKDHRSNSQQLQGAPLASAAQSGRQQQQQQPASSTSASPASVASTSLSPDVQSVRVRSTSPVRMRRAAHGLEASYSEDFIERKEAPQRQLYAEFADPAAAAAAGMSLQMFGSSSPERRANAIADSLAAAGSSSLSTRPSIIRDRYAHYRRSPGPDGSATPTATTPLASPTAAPSQSDAPLCLSSPSPSSSSPFQSALSSPDFDDCNCPASTSAAGLLSVCPVPASNQCVASVLVHSPMSSQSSTSTAGRLGRQFAFDHSNSSSTPTIPHQRQPRDSVRVLL